MVKTYGPKEEFSIEIQKWKHRLPGESHKDASARVANALCDDDEHFVECFDILKNQRFLPGGRVQSGAGSPRDVTLFNCFVSQTIEDTSESIFDSVTRAFQTMRKGGGIGYDFSTLRPEGSDIVSLQSTASGPLSFMKVFDATCGAVKSAGHRRGAQMGALRIDHPDIEKFITAKNNQTDFTNFNLSIAVTDEFMEAVESGDHFDLKFNGRIYKTVKAERLWDMVMRSTWDWAEPGILFIDRINDMNNLGYCETIAATNPCAEQVLPSNGACLLGSFNLVKYVYEEDGTWKFDFDQFTQDIWVIVRMMDNVVDRSIYPLEDQKIEAHNKRRMGLGVAGLANALERLGYRYGSDEFLGFAELIFRTLTNEAYSESARLAGEKGSFPLYDVEKYLRSKFLNSGVFDERTIELIETYGIRNSHLTSIAPTGTISLCADNISSGIEPPYELESIRDVTLADGSKKQMRVSDYAYRVWGIRGKTASECTVDDHIGVLLLAAKYQDSAVSKTCNVGDDVTWDEFKDIYMKAWKGGAKGCTTFRAAGKRFGIMRKVDEDDQQTEGAACYIDPATGIKTCE